MRHHAWLPLALAASCLAATTAQSCSSPEECCDVCGADSYRCARGPCSSSVITKSFFSISMPTHNVDFWDVAFTFYGMVPYLVPITLALAILLLRRCRTWTLIFAFLFIPIVGVINAVILVQSLGDCAECPRPCGACVPSNGMPSGHAANSVGLCLWIILETFLGVGKRWHKRKQLAVVLLSVLLLAPVPYSRMYLGDHTSLEVIVGSAIGAVLGLVYFLILRLWIGKKLDRASDELARGKCCSITVVNDFYGDKHAAHSASAPSSDNLETGGFGAQNDRAYAQAPATPLL
ncbi:hypothetical protein Gpo141_00014864 [Globisporangium polare]